MSGAVAASLVLTHSISARQLVRTAFGSRSVPFTHALARSPSISLVTHRKRAESRASAVNISKNR